MSKSGKSRLPPNSLVAAARSARERAAASGEIVTKAEPPRRPRDIVTASERRSESTTRSAAAVRAWVIMGASASATVLVGLFFLSDPRRTEAERPLPVAPERVHPTVTPLGPPSGASAELGPLAPSAASAELVPPSLAAGAAASGEPGPPGPPAARPLPTSTAEAGAPAVTPSLPPRRPGRPRARQPSPEADGTSAGASARIAADAETSAQLGYLTLDSAPWAEVSLDGKVLGSTPLLRVPLPPGRHTLTLRNPERKSSTSYVVDIAPGDTTSRFVGWDGP